MVSFQDGSTAAADPDNHLCACSKTSPAYPAHWLRKVAADTDGRKRLPDASCAYVDPDGHCHPSSMEGSSSAGRMLPVPKLRVRGVLG